MSSFLLSKVCNMTHGKDGVTLTQSRCVEESRVCDPSKYQAEVTIHLGYVHLLDPILTEYGVPTVRKWMAELWDLRELISLLRYVSSVVLNNDDIDMRQLKKLSMQLTCSERLANELVARLKGKDDHVKSITFNNCYHY